MVNHIVSTMPYLQGEMPDRRLIRMVFTERKWGISGVVKSMKKKNSTAHYHNVFVSVPKSCKYYFSSEVYHNLSTLENIQRVAELIYRITVHELQHLEDRLSNAWGLESIRPFSRAQNTRRPKHNTRPEEIRADKAMNDFELDTDIVESLSKEIEKYYQKA